MFEYDGDQYTLQELQDSAKSQSIDFETFMKTMRNKGLTEKTVEEEVVEEQPVQQSKYISEDGKMNILGIADVDADSFIGKVVRTTDTLSETLLRIPGQALGDISEFIEGYERSMVQRLGEDRGDTQEQINEEIAKIEEKGGLTTIDKTNSNFFYDFNEKMLSNSVVEYDKTITEDLLEGNFDRATLRTVDAGFASLPSIVAAYYGGPAMVALGVTVAGNKFNEEFEKNPENSATELFNNAIGSGIIEVGGEMITRGLFKNAGFIADEVGEVAAKKALKNGYLQIAKRIGFGVGTEGFSESLTELVSQTFDAISIEGREMPTWDDIKYQLGDNFIVGGLVGGTITTLGEVGKSGKAAKRRAELVLMPIEDKKIIQEKAVKIQSLLKDRSRAKGKAKERLNKEIDFLSVEIQRIQDKNSVALNNLKGKNLKDYASNVREINVLRKEIKENPDNESVKNINQENIRLLSEQNKNLIDESLQDVTGEQFESVEKLIDRAKEQGLKVTVQKGDNDAMKKFAADRGMVDDQKGVKYGGFIPVENDKGEIVGLDLFINEQTSIKNGMLNTAAHEFFHGAIYSTLKQDVGAQMALGDSLLRALKDNKAALKKDSDFNYRINSYTENEGQGEEILALTIEALRNKEIDLNEGFVQDLRDVWRRFGQKYLNFEIKFDTDQDVLNFVKDFNKTIDNPGSLSKAMLNLMTKGAKGKILPVKKSDKSQPQALSKEASDNVQRLYESKNENKSFEFDIIKEFKPIVSRIADKRREAPNFDKELLMSEIEIGSRGILDLIKEYKPESGVPLAAFINKFLPSRAIEASRRVLGEEFMQDVSERVDIAAEEVADVEVKAKPKKKKILLADRLRVENKVDAAVKKIFPSLNLKKLDFKSLKDLTPEITGKLFGISPKKLLNNANITKVELQAAQMFINKNADLLIAMLPEGATVSGTSTGVQKVLLDAFYTKSNRARAAKTGSKAGLAIQVKKPNITKQEFLETFGIIDGKPVRTDRNTSSRVLALAKQTGKMMSNQAVRKILLSDKNSPAHVLGILEDGKPKMMWSQQSSLNADQIQKQGASERNLEQRTIGEEFLESQKDWKDIVKDAGYDPLDMISDDGVIDYLQLLYYGLGPKLPESFFRHNGTYQGTSKAIKDKDGNTIKRTRTRNYPFINTKQVQNSVDNVLQNSDFVGFAEPDVDIENAMQRHYYPMLLKMDSKKRQELLESKARGFKKIWQAFDELIESDPELGIPLVGALMSSVSATQIHFGRTASIFSFYNTLNEANVEEHAGPASDMNKFLLNRAIDGNLFGDLNYFDGAVQSFIQGDLPARFDSPVLKGEGYNYVKNAPPEHAYDILLGLKPIWIRYWNTNVNNNGRDFNKGIVGGIDPNVIVLLNGKTIAQEYGVDVDGDLLTPHVIMMQQDLLADIFLGKTTVAKAKKSITNFANVKLKKQIGAYKIKEKAIKQGRLMASKDPKGITVLDFDDTLATSKSLIRYTKPDGEEGTLTPEQYASTYEDLLDNGYEFDFSEFNKVVDGKIAPLFQKALKLQGKFGPENMFVLTARPPQSQRAIFEFLKANGLNIPLKNITGLGNSTAEAKALWMADKVGEGYNDFYFADDALQNVQAVDNILEQFDVKRKVQQAKIQFSKDLDTSFNNILEDVTGIKSVKRFDFIKARKRGASKGKFRLFIPPSHEDFVGLLYNFMGKGRKGDAHRDFLEQALVRPLNRANKEYDTARQSVATDYKNLNKQMPGVKEMFTKETPDGDFIYQDAIRVYLWDKHGYDIPGLSPVDQKNLVELVNSDPDLKSYADTINTISKQDTYVNPTDGWDSGDIRMDLDDATGRIGRSQFFEEFIENADVIFSTENLNKIEAAYGKGMKDALEDMLYRIKTGRNKPTGQNGMVNSLMNWVNGSVGSVMFFNMRSALLQQMSLVNYINFADNNVFAAAKAFANQPQYWKDWSFIFNSDMLKQRRGGIMTDVNGAELAAEMRKSKSPHRFLISKLLELGFLPTQIGDNIAIATGGATYYRNRINTYLKQGLNKKEAEAKAFTDFQDITQSTQQSARPDMVSQQQASLIGKIILNFQNVTSQFNRLGKKAFLDIKNRRITKPNSTQMQSDISNAARITYYFAVQNAIFYTLQTALFAMMFDDDEEDVNNLFLKKQERLINGSIDSVLRGSGILGGVIATLKNVAIAFARQRDVNYNPDESAVIVEALNFSPVIGIKARKVVNAEKTLNYNKKVIKEMETFDIDNPQWSAVTNYIEGFTNAPLNRLYNKTQNVRQGLNNEHTSWERALMFLGWSQYNLNIENKKIEEVKEKIKTDKKKTKKKKTKGKFKSLIK